MKTPTVMGCPLWLGVKPRVAKKHLKHEIWRDSRILKLMSDIDVGDLIRDCSSFNTRVAKIEPIYRRAGSGVVLRDIEITNTNGGLCSFVYCGVEPAASRAEILVYWEQISKYWTSIGDPWGFAQRYEFTTVDADGVAIVDQAGLEAKYGKR